ncbi:hypothetical protein EGW08_017073 [Elysia chlorotica]|uniref:BESS domain-containing protein n=1 Tax=Elysia chlorotica TaxID=188477 RepID=A0A433T0U4_ELYCH|nr:hypothetical protein EGW08_017073 [Elysia chlorotica]
MGVRILTATRICHILLIVATGAAVLALPLSMSPRSSGTPPHGLQQWTRSPCPLAAVERLLTACERRYCSGSPALHVPSQQWNASSRPATPQEESNDSQEIHSLPSPTQHTLPSSPSPSQHPLTSLPSPSPTPASSAGSDKKATRLVKRKAPAEDEVAAELLKVLRESDKLDEGEQFCNSCLPMVRTLSGEGKLEFRTSVQQLLSQAVRRRSTAARGHGERVPLLRGDMESGRARTVAPLATIRII